MTRRYATVLLALLLGAGGPAAAAGLMFGQWRVATTPDGHYVYAATVNRRGELFGEFCDFKSASCRWLLAVDTPCRLGEMYPVLADSAAGVHPIAILCVGPMGAHTYGMVLLNRNRLRASIAHAPAIGFFMPVPGGRIAFTRFELAGRLQATALLHKSFSAEIARRQRIRAAEARL